MSDVHFQCINCHTNFPISQIRYRCDCGELLDIVRNDWKSLKNNLTRKIFDNRLGTNEFPYAGGVWRYQEFLPPIETRFIVSQQEGSTPLYAVGKSASDGYGGIGRFAGIDTLYVKHEGHNPTGSFKDRGMTVGMSFAKKLGVKAVACASTGNTSSSLASYAALAGLTCFVYLPKGKVSSSKLAQTIAYGAKIVQINGDFDQTMKEVEEASIKKGIYLLNSINPFRIEGQKTIGYELVQQLQWQPPDWIVIPGGNLGNTAAIGKAVFDLFHIGLMRHIPRIAVIQATGANPFYLSFKSTFTTYKPVQAETVASAIRIGNPLSFAKAKGVIQETNGVVEEVTDREIIEAKVIIDRSGIGCEPASATTVAGIRKLVQKQIIRKTDVVCAILTGHILKDSTPKLKK